MQITDNREERAKQKEILRTIYPDYDPKRHDAFVHRYSLEQDKKALQEYMKERGII